MRRLRLVAALGAAFVALLAVSAPTANASYGPLAEYQLTFSQNCNNPAFCLGGPDGGLGGSWGWAVLNSDGTGDAQITFCGHAPGLGGGAGHVDLDIFAWSVDTANGVFRVDSASDPEFVGDTPFPSAPGHYNLHPAPGVSIQITVAKIPGR
jgi:hypothetical protein